MMRRALVVLLFLLSCRSGELETLPASQPSEATRQTQTSSLEYVEIVLGDASEPLPIIVAVHGLGDTPEHFGGLFEEYPGPARIILPRAPISYGQGFSWFFIDINDLGDEALGEGVAKAADLLAALLAELYEKYPASGKPVLTGFSQGGMLSFAAAVLHPEALKEAIPLAGFLPASLLPPKRPGAAVPIRALHGAADKVLPFSLAQKSSDSLRGLGFSVELQKYPGVGHQIPREMRRDFFALLQKATRE